MKKLIYLSLFIAFISVLSCARSAREPMEKEDPMPTKYENELFSVMVPYGWVCETSNWKGLDAMRNEVDIYDPNKSIVSFHFVKTFFPFKWKNMSEVKAFAKSARASSGEDVKLIDEIDSVEVGGYPACILLFENYTENDTIIQKQFVTYLQDSHIVVYFNEAFPVSFWEDAQEFGDAIISTIKLKKVKNPLDDKKVLEKALEVGMKRHEVDDKYLDRARELQEEWNRQKTDILGL